MSYYPPKGSQIQGAACLTGEWTAGKRERSTQPSYHSSPPSWPRSRKLGSTQPPRASSAACQRPLLGDCVRKVAGGFSLNRKPCPACTTETHRNAGMQGLEELPVVIWSTHQLCELKIYNILQSWEGEGGGTVECLDLTGICFPLLYVWLGCHRNLRE